MREFLQKSIEKKKLCKIFEAARLAPSVANMQPWSFIIVDDQETKLRLKAAYDKDWFINTPVIVVACGLPEEAWRKRQFIPPRTEDYW